MWSFILTSGGASLAWSFETVLYQLHLVVKVNYALSRLSTILCVPIITASVTVMSLVKVINYRGIYNITLTSSAEAFGRVRG